jgi:hypothetical protein
MAIARKKTVLIMINWVHVNVSATSTPGINVMVTIFGDFEQFSAKIALFLKNNAMAIFSALISIFYVKITIFSNYFFEQYFPMHNVGPRTLDRRLRLCEDGQLHHEDGHEAAAAHPAHLGGAGHEEEQKSRRKRGGWRLMAVLKGD